MFGATGSAETNTHPVTSMKITHEFKEETLIFFGSEGMSSIVAFHPQNVVLAVKSCHNLWFG